ncbi:hypothetical protein CLAFUR0_14389 [Fulvia fulva]|nr:hypothetical protein CLAFUR0_14389 [Fulvia fulva]
MPRAPNPRPQNVRKGKAPPCRKQPTPSPSPSLSPSPKTSDFEAEIEDPQLSPATADQEALAWAGLYPNPTTDNLDSQKWCTCNIDPSSKVDLENMIRCNHRACDPGWYHLSCVQLTEPPPRQFCWFCPRCVNEGLVAEHRNGVFELGDPGAMPLVEDWWREEKERRRSRKLKRKGSFEGWRGRVKRAKRVEREEGA